MLSVKETIIILFVLFCIISCNGVVEQRPKVSGGKTNEIVVVLSENLQWDEHIGSAVKGYFEQPDTMLSQPERLYSVAPITQKMFDNSSIFYHHHNIFIIEKDTAHKEPTFSTAEDTWSKPQRVFWLKFSNDRDFFSLFDRYKSIMLNKFDENEIQRTYQTLKLGSNQAAGLTIEKKFQFQMDVPAGFSIATTDSNFLWMTQTVAKKNQDLIAGITIRQEPYHDEKQFSIDHIIRSRNGVTMRYINGPSGHSFMKVSMEYIPPVAQVLTDFPGGYAVEIRGLWDMVDDFMGGPFISYTFLNPVTRMLVTVEGFVYNPNHEKRVFLRQLQSVFWNLKLKPVDKAS